jgi:hypothetical protein
VDFVDLVYSARQNNFSPNKTPQESLMKKYQEGSRERGKMIMAILFSGRSRQQEQD